MGAAVALEVGRAVDVRQLRAKRGEGGAWARIDVLDHHGSGNGPIRLPQFGAVCAVVEREVERAVDVRQVRGRAAVEGKLHVSGDGPIRHPKVFEVDEEDMAADGQDLDRPRLGGVNGPYRNDLTCARDGSVTDPQTRIFI